MKNLTPGNPKMKSSNQNNNASLNNLTPGNPSSKRKRVHRTILRHATHHDVGTNMHEMCSYKNPSPATLTKLDRRLDQAVMSIERINQARALTTRSRNESIMLIQFTLKFMTKHRCTLTRDVEETSTYFQWCIVMLSGAPSLRRSFTRR